MFTGLVSDVGQIIDVKTQGDLRRIRIACSYELSSIALGASIACSGPCLTAVDMGVIEHKAVGARSTWFDVEAAAETLERTTVGRWRVGDYVNLERSLRLGDELGGHIVTGHVDGVAEICELTRFAEGTAQFTIRAPHRLAHLIAEKGSVALDGTSLTVNSVSGDEFSVLLIPHTLSEGVTTWGARHKGDMINIEVDLMARYAARLIEARQSPTQS
jgi:riboflavin synthase